VTLELVERGSGPTTLLIHGSAADASTWSIQLASLSRELRMVAPQRRNRDSVETAADDIVEVIEALNDGPVLACASSFGAVILLDVARRFPDRLRGMVLCEPPLAPSDYSPSVPLGFGCQFDRLVLEQSGEAAAEYFLRTVLTDTAYEALPTRWQKRACALWREIRADSGALARYAPRYASLVDVAVPTLLLGGERSSKFYCATLDALEQVLPNVRRQTLRGAGHMMQADAHRGFNTAVLEFFGSLS